MLGMRLYEVKLTDEEHDRLVNREGLEDETPVPASVMPLSVLFDNLEPLWAIMK